MGALRKHRSTLLPSQGLHPFPMDIEASLSRRVGGTDICCTESVFWGGKDNADGRAYLILKMILSGAKLFSLRGE